MLHVEFFHGTSSVAFEKIKQEGLRPHAGVGAIEWAKVHRPTLYSREAHNPVVGQSIYLTTNPQWALRFAAIASEITKSDPVILRVKISAKDAGKLWIDDSFVNRLDDDRYGVSFRFEGDIHPRRLKAVKRNGTKFANPLS